MHRGKSAGRFSEDSAARKKTVRRDFALEACGVIARIEAANTRLVALQHAMMPRPFEERQRTLASSLETIMHEKALVAEAKKALVRCAPRPAADAPAPTDEERVRTAVERSTAKIEAARTQSLRMCAQLRGEGDVAAASAHFCAILMDERATHGRWAWALIDECASTDRKEKAAEGGGAAAAAAAAQAACDPDEYDDGEGMAQKSYTDMLVAFCIGRLAKVRAALRCATRRALLPASVTLCVLSLSHDNVLSLARARALSLALSLSRSLSRSHTHSFAFRRGTGHRAPLQALRAGRRGVCALPCGRGAGAWRRVKAELDQAL